VISVASPVDVRTIGKLHAKLKETLERGNGICLRLAADADVDLTFVQLLEAARRVTVDGTSVVLDAPASDALHSILERGGFLKTAASRAFWLHEPEAQ
jgi:hypothetical protein